MLTETKYDYANFGIPKENVIENITIPQYMEEVLLSKARRPKYYVKSDKLPKKLLKLIEVGTLVWTNKVLTTVEGTKVVKNNRVAGKPRTHRISGQDLWSGIDHNLRSKVSKELKKYMYSFIKDIKPIKEYPIGIAINFYNVPGNYDLDNLEYWYRKSFQDSLAGNVEFMTTTVVQKTDSTKTKKLYIPDRKKYPPKILDDSVMFIKAKPCAFIDTADKENRRIEIIIYKI